MARTTANYMVDYASSADVYYLSNSFRYIQYRIGTNEYVNNTFLCNTAVDPSSAKGYRVSNSHLNYTYQNGSSVNHYMSVGGVKIKAVSAPISFESSSGARSSSAVLLYMDKGTAYCYKKSWLNYVPGGVSGAGFSFVDFRMGIDTPRAFDFYDVDDPHEQILVYDIEGEYIVDFVGSANYFYHTGEYQASMSYV